MSTINFTTSNAEFKTINASSKNTLTELIGIKFTAIGKAFIQAEMPVDQRTHQPYGRLHGGASMAMIETLGSIASYLLVATNGMVSVGVEINANHVRAARDGYVTGTATPLHIGHTTHVWEVRIRDQQHKLICAGRMTIAIIPAEQG